jgi:hypothetical protein
MQAPALSERFVNPGEDAELHANTAKPAKQIAKYLILFRGLPKRNFGRDSAAPQWANQ